MAMSRILLLSSLFVLAAGCQVHSGSVGVASSDRAANSLAPPLCRLSPDTLDFGRVITPEFGWVTDYVTMPFTVENAGDTPIQPSRCSRATR
jgi:hypothetical protein